MSRPQHLPGRLPAGLCIFGMTYLCGLTWADTDRANPQPLTARQIIDLAAGDGLSWVEMPARLLGAETPEALADLRAYAADQGIRFVLPSGRLQEEVLLADLPIAAALGASTLRCTLSGVLCGDRRGFPGGWKEHLATCERVLERVLPEAERLGVAIAMENHQDADSEDLLRLCRRFESRYLGVTLDCANPLAVMEEPVAFAERLAPYLRHAHLKDYRIHPASNGFRLVRCATGAGVVNFPALFELFDAQEWPITRNIEVGALQARQIPILEPSWWDEFAPRDTRSILPALSVVWANLRPQEEEWRTPLERDTPAEELAAYEWVQYYDSVAYLHRVLGTGNADGEMRIAD